MNYFLTVPCFLLLSVFTAAAEGEKELLAVLTDSKVSRNDRITACQNLGRVGTKASIPALASLLGDPALEHAARYALEMIPGPAVEEAFCDAAETLQGAALLEIVQSMGNRGNARSVAILAKTLQSGDGEIRKASAYALGKLATPAAMAALKGRLGQSPDIAIAYLNGAVKNPDASFRAACCEDIRNTNGNVYPSTKDGATLTEILAAGETGLNLWDACISGPKEAANVALRAVLAYPPSATATKRFSAALKSNPAVRLPLCAVLADRGDEAAVPDLLTLAGGKSVEERFAAAKALAQMNQPAAVPVLVDLLTGPDAGFAKSAQDTLAGFNGKAADEAVVKLLSSADAAIRFKAVELVMRRRMSHSLAEVAKLNSDPDAKIRDFALKTVGELGTPSDTQLLMDILMKDTSNENVARALGDLCRRFLKPRKGKIVVKSAVFGYFPKDMVRDVTDNAQKLADQGAAAILSDCRLCRADGGKDDPAPDLVKSLRIFYTFDDAPFSAEVREGDTYYFGELTLHPAVLKSWENAYRQAQAAQKTALLNLCASFGTLESVGMLRKAEEGADDAVKETIIRALAGWKTPDVVNDLAIFAQTAPSERLKILALRGYVRLTEDNFRLTHKERLEALQKALAWAPRDTEKQLVATAINQAQAALEQSGFTVIFNGRDLAGWHGGGGFWRAQNGILTGESTPDHKVAKTTYLIYDKELADFEFSCEFRMSKSANSGIQLRAPNQEFVDSGYQADMDGGGSLPGMVYHPAQSLVGQRGTKTAFDKDGKKTVADLPSRKDVDKVYRVENWNEYRVSCKGRVITLWVNHVLMNIFEDNRPILPEKGFLGLQIHPGDPMKIEFRNVRLKTQ